MTTNLFYPSLLLLYLDLGSEIQDPGSGMGKNQDPGSGINIPDPQHWVQHNGSKCCGSGMIFLGSVSDFEWRFGSGSGSCRNFLGIVLLLFIHLYHMCKSRILTD
jgi:hypothetical protein